MLFTIGYTTTSEVDHIWQVFQATQLRLEAYLQNKQYGEAVQEFFIGLICVSSDFERFFKPRRDRYTKDRKVYYRDGFEIIRNRTFECEIELPYDRMINASSKEAVVLISQEVVRAVERLYKHQAKLEDFAIATLVEDIKDFFMDDKYNSNENDI